MGPLKPFTIKGKIYNMMLRAKESKDYIAIDEESLPRRKGSKVSNSTLSANISAITKEYFPGHRFCYFTKGDSTQRFIAVSYDPCAQIEKNVAIVGFDLAYTAQIENPPTNGKPAVRIGQPPKVSEFIEIKGYAFFAGAWSR